MGFGEMVHYLNQHLSTDWCSVLKPYFSKAWFFFPCHFFSPLYDWDLCLFQNTASGFLGSLKNEETLHYGDKIILECPYCIRRVKSRPPNNQPFPRLLLSQQISLSLNVDPFRLACLCCFTSLEVMLLRKPQETHWLILAGCAFFHLRSVMGALRHLQFSLVLKTEPLLALITGFKSGGREL